MQLHDSSLSQQRMKSAVDSIPSLPLKSHKAQRLPANCAVLYNQHVGLKRTGEGNRFGRKCRAGVCSGGEEQQESNRTALDCRAVS